MRKRRYARGSLDFDLPEPKLVLDKAGEITGIVATERLDSMRMIEEFMLAANEAVAERLARSGIPTLFRVHETPDPSGWRSSPSSWPLSATACPATWRPSGPRISSSSCARSQGSRRRSSSRTCCCGP